jgi:hypothetical protein
MRQDALSAGAGIVCDERGDLQWGN